MTKIPFDIKFRPQIESGEYKVVDKDNHNIRIICWDKKSEKKYGYHIVGLVEFGPDHEESTYYTIDGKGRLRDKHPCLFIVTPEEELSEWEKAVGRAITDAQLIPRDKDGVANIHDIDEFIKSKAAELLSLAKDEIYSHENLVEYAEKAMAAGKAEALKDLPRWKRFRRNSQDYPFFSNCEDGENCLVFNGKCIKMCELLKLPGFKEED